jgi:hypothetical protein
MATASNNRVPREVVDFPPNIPVTLSLKYPQGKPISNQYGERMMYTTIANHVLFLDLPVAAQIERLGINVGEAFTITRKTDGKKDSPTVWDVARAMGQQPNGTLVLPAPPEPKPAQRAESPNARLVEEANALVDAYALVLERALTTYQGRVKPDEVRTLLVTAYIQRSKLSSCA